MNGGTCWTAGAWRGTRGPWSPVGRRQPAALLSAHLLCSYEAVTCTKSSIPNPGSPSPAPAPVPTPPPPWRMSLCAWYTIPGTHPHALDPRAHEAVLEVLEVLLVGDLLPSEGLALVDRAPRALRCHGARVPAVARTNPSALRRAAALRHVTCLQSPATPNGVKAAAKA
jgi:hypothetical protein